MAHTPARPSGRSRGRLAAALALWWLSAAPAAAQVVEPGGEPAPAPAGSELSLADLAPYRAALDGKPAGPAAPATFRELWGHPDRYRGRRVRVEGRVARRFRQGAFGTFPPLVEAWAVAPSGDPLCLVFPDPSPGPDPAGSLVGASVAFEGVFLRSIRYAGGDTARLAPLIVGDRAPAVTGAAPKPAAGPVSRGRGAFSAVDWALGAGAAAVVIGALVVQHLRRAPARLLRLDRGAEPPPEFLAPGGPGADESGPPAG